MLSLVVYFEYLKNSTIRFGQVRELLMGGWWVGFSSENKDRNALASLIKVIPVSIFPFLEQVLPLKNVMWNICILKAVLLWICHLKN